MIFKSKTADFVTIGFLAAGFGYLFYRTYSFSPSLLPGYPGDAFFPRWVLGFALVCCAVIIVRLIWESLARTRNAVEADGKDPDTVTFDPVQFVYIIALVLGYIFLLPVIGFELCTFLFLFILLITRWFGDWRSRIVKVAILSAGTAFFFYFTFVVLLNVSFPVKLLPEYIELF
jgi:putative tricarboxylic transport membrane protein